MAQTQITSSSQRVEVTARGLDLAARSIDLLGTLADLSNSPHNAVQIAASAMYWLGRERINAEDLEHCLLPAKDLVRPNFNALQFYKEVLAGIERLPQPILKPFKAISSGSLGRILVIDAGLRWITSTISALLQFHNEAFVTQVIGALILQLSAQKDGNSILGWSDLWSSPTYLRMTPVVEKITSSVWLNIVNSGCASIPLPETLREICPIGHHLDIEDLVESLTRLYSPVRGSRIIISSQYLLGNLTLWLLYHFHGNIRIVVSGETIIESRLGSEEREIEIRVSFRCTVRERCHEAWEKDRRFEMLEYHARDWKQFFVGASKSSSNLGSLPQTRRTLYDLDSWQTTVSSDAATLKGKIRKVSLNLVRWLCSLRARPFTRGSTGIVYEVSPKKSTVSNQNYPLLSDLFHQLPSILQAPWAPDLDPGWSAEGAVDIWSPQGFAEVASSAAERHPASPNGLVSMEEGSPGSIILKCYPGLDDLVKKAQGACQCPSCAEDRKIAYLQPGCLRFYVYAAAMSLLAHSITDAFGADDVSGAEETSFRKPNPVASLVEKVLVDIAKNGRIVWETWFQVATSCYLGRCVNMETTQQGSGIPPAGKTMTIAVQYGELAVVAPWIDISKEVSHLRSFGFVPIHGRLCIPPAEKSTFSSSMSQQEVDSKFAVIRSRLTEYAQVKVDEEATDISNITIVMDEQKVDSDFILIPCTDELYHLVMIIRTGRYSRLINPCDAAIARSKLFRDWPLAPCADQPFVSTAESAPVAPESIVVLPFDRLLVRWPSRSLHQVHMSMILDTDLKFNVALGLTLDGIVTVTRQSDWKRAAEKLLETEGRRLHMSSGRFLIIAERQVQENGDDRPSPRALQLAT